MVKENAKCEEKQKQTGHSNSFEEHCLRIDPICVNMFECIQVSSNNITQLILFVSFSSSSFFFSSVLFFWFAFLSIIYADVHTQALVPRTFVRIHELVASESCVIM